MAGSAQELDEDDVLRLVLQVHRRASDVHRASENLRTERQRACDTGAKELKKLPARGMRPPVKRRVIVRILFYEAIEFILSIHGAPPASN